jgi:hypothetical protein
MGSSLAESALPIAQNTVGIGDGGDDSPLMWVVLPLSLCLLWAADRYMARRVRITDRRQQVLAFLGWIVLGASLTLSHLGKMYLSGVTHFDLAMSTFGSIVIVVACVRNAYQLW